MFIKGNQNKLERLAKKCFFFQVKKFTNLSSSLSIKVEENKLESFSEKKFFIR